MGTIPQLGGRPISALVICSKHVTALLAKIAAHVPNCNNGTSSVTEMWYSAS